MATVNLGSIKFNWQGAYNGATAYSVDDVVSYNGASYICTAASTGNLPTDTNFWDQMSSAGTDGTDLTTTLTTQGDIVYRDASGLARLGAGTSGQALLTGGAGANPSWGNAGGILQYQETVYTTANKVNGTNGQLNVDAPSTLGDGTFGVTIQNASSTLRVLWKIHVGHNTTWTQQFSRIQYKIGSGGSWTHLDGLGSTAYHPDHAMTGNTVFSEARLSHGQTVGTNIYFRIQTNYSHSGSYMRWNTQDPSDTAADPTATNEGTYARSFIAVYEQL